METKQENTEHMTSGVLRGNSSCYCKMFGESLQTQALLLF